MTQVAVSVGVGLTLFLTSTAGALWRAMGCILWNRLIILTVTLGALALSASSSLNQILGVACVGLVLIVGIEQVTVRRQMARMLQSPQVSTSLCCTRVQTFSPWIARGVENRLVISNTAG